MTALERWAEDLRGWGIPDEILARAPESPWGFPPELMHRRVSIALRDPPTPSVGRAREALPPGGSVLDVGVGTGAASLPLADRAGQITGVDTSEDMLAAFLEVARRLGVRTRAVCGRWPDVSRDVIPADVVVCHHVLYNVQDLAPFVQALHQHARRRVVVEITERHPLSWMNGLWRRFHGLRRPTGPSADDAALALGELGFDAHLERVTARPRSSGFERREDAVSLVRRRLCLSAERDDEIAEALGDLLVERDGLWSAGPLEQTLVTLWWDADGD